MLFRRRHGFRYRHFWRGVLHVLGPGLITGAADDDPSGIATYSQAGAQFGYAMALGDAVHLAADGGDPGDQRPHRAGHRQGDRREPARALSAPLLRVIVVLLLAANFINLGADLGAMGDALRLLIGGPRGFTSSCSPPPAPSSKSIPATSATSNFSNG